MYDSHSHLSVLDWQKGSSNKRTLVDVVSILLGKGENKNGVHRQPEARTLAFPPNFSLPASDPLPSSVPAGSLEEPETRELTPQVDRCGV